MFPRQNSSAGALDWFRQGSASRRRRFVPKASSLFFPGQKTPYTRRWASRACQVAHEVGGAPRGVGRALHPRGGLVSAPDCYLFFYFSKYPKTEKYFLKIVLESVYLPYHIPIPFRSLKHSRKRPLCIPPGS